MFKVLPYCFNGSNSSIQTFNIVDGSWLRVRAFRFYETLYQNTQSIRFVDERCTCYSNLQFTLFRSWVLSWKCFIVEKKAGRSDLTCSCVTIENEAKNKVFIWIKLLMAFPVPCWTVALDNNHLQNMKKKASQSNPSDFNSRFQ